MPDWNYHTTIKPALKLLPDQMGHAVALGALRILGSNAVLRKSIDFMGHMKPPHGVGFNIGTTRFSSRVFLGQEIDSCGGSVKALGKFGFGAIEIAIGPKVDTSAGEGTYLWREQKLVCAKLPRVRSPEIIEKKIKASQIPLVLVFDLDDACAFRPDELLQEFAEWARLKAPLRMGEVLTQILCTLPPAESEEFLKGLSLLAKATGVEFIFSLPMNEAPVKITAFLDFLARLEFRYLALANSSRSGIYTFQAANLQPQISFIKSQASLKRFKIIATAGVCSPEDYHELRTLGVEAVVLNHGFIEFGPGLPKRLNYREENFIARARKPSGRSTVRMSWFWGALLGVCMFSGGLLTLFIAKTQIIFPYDEAASGLKKEVIAAFNEKILHFMAHDRATLAGTMLSIGILYFSASWFGSRQGLRWYRDAVTYSALFGFFNFFAFISFGYFDMFHAFVSACLFQIFVMCVYAYVSPTRSLPLVWLKNCSVWKQALWGQFLFVIQAAGLILAGTVITYFASTTVFVPQDGEFLGMTAEALKQFSPNLIPLIAHDRCTFGGMLVSAGISLLLFTLWGFEAGQRWLWWTFLLSGLPPYLITLWIHDHVGYTSFIHLLPVYIGLALLVTALGLTYRYFFKVQSSQPLAES